MISPRFVPDFARRHVWFGVLAACAGTAGACAARTRSDAATQSSNFTAEPQCDAPIAAAQGELVGQGFVQTGATQSTLTFSNPADPLGLVGLLSKQVNNFRFERRDADGLHVKWATCNGVIGPSFALGKSTTTRGTWASDQPTGSRPLVITPSDFVVGGGITGIQSRLNLTVTTDSPPTLCVPFNSCKPLTVPLTVALDSGNELQFSTADGQSRLAFDATGGVIGGLLTIRWRDLEDATDVFTIAGAVVPDNPAIVVDIVNVGAAENITVKPSDRIRLVAVPGQPSHIEVNLAPAVQSFTLKNDSAFIVDFKGLGTSPANGQLPSNESVRLDASMNGSMTLNPGFPQPSGGLLEVRFIGPH
jgi:hypothetical protein